MIGIGMGLGVAGVGGGGGGSVFTANAVNFDGTNDFLDIAGALSGAVDNKTGLFSFWLNFNGGNGISQQILIGGDSDISFLRRTDDKIVFTLRDAANLIVWQAITTTTFNDLSGWMHFLLSLNAGLPARHIFVNDILETVTSETTNDTTINWDGVVGAIGATAAAANKIDADMAEVYFTNEFLDISVEANRRKFIDLDGKPVDLGGDGSVPTGTVPLVFQSGATVFWHTNKGSGGGFTENGALTDAATSPSD